MLSLKHLPHNAKFGTSTVMKPRSQIKCLYVTKSANAVTFTNIQFNIILTCRVKAVDLKGHKVM